MEIGANIKKYRKRKKLTQEKLRKQIGKSEKMLQKYENGSTIPSIEILIKIAEALDITLFDLLGDSKLDNKLNKMKEIARLLYEFRNKINESHVWNEMKNETKLFECNKRIDEIQAEILNKVIN